MRGVLRFFPVVFLVFVLSACAGRQDFSKFEKHGEMGFQEFRVSTPGTTGAYCFLQTRNATYQVKTPGVVMVERSAQPMRVSCFKGEHFHGETTVDAKKAAEQGRGSRYAYPPSVAVSMKLAKKSMVRQVEVF